MTTQPDSRRYLIDDPATGARLARTVVELHDEVARLRDHLAAATNQIGRLRRILAVEAGDAAMAPEGWRPTTGGAWSGKEDNYVYRIAAGRWSWVSRDTRNKVRGRGDSPSALEAMEAADAARKEVTR